MTCRGCGRKNPIDEAIEEAELTRSWVASMSWVAVLAYPGVMRGCVRVVEAHGIVLDVG